MSFATAITPSSYGLFTLYRPKSLDIHLCSDSVVHLAPSAALHGSILGELLRRGLSPITPLNRKLCHKGTRNLKVSIRKSDQPFFIDCKAGRRL